MKPTNRKFLKKSDVYHCIDPLKSRPGWYECVCGCGQMYWWTGEGWSDAPNSSRVVVVLHWRGVSR